MTIIIRTLNTMNPLTTQSEAPQKSPPAPTSDIPNPTSPPQGAPLPALSPPDRDRLNLLFRTLGHIVSFISLRAEEPLDLLAWLSQPHVRPWVETITNAHRENRQADATQALSKALRDITRILDIEANSTLKIRAINSIIKLAN